MKRKVLSVMVVFCMLFSMVFFVKTTPVEAADQTVCAIYGGDPFVTGGQAVMDDLRESGYNTVIIWSVHVHSNGDLYINGNLVCSGGAYVGQAAWKTQWATLRQAPTTINRVELSVGAAGCTDFEGISDLIAANGTGKNTVLYKNFAALIAATGADAINYDDESLYDVASSVSFGQMCNAMGVKVTLCPYSNTNFWADVKTQLGSTVDRVYLQCYDGGAGNDPEEWTNNMGMKVIPGLWGKNSSASDVGSYMGSWKNSISGGFMWQYDEMPAGQPKLYASAINSAFKNVVSSSYPFIMGDTEYKSRAAVNIGSLNKTSGANGGYADFNSIVTDMSVNTPINVK